MNAYELLALPPQLVIKRDQLDAAWREAGKIHHPDAGGEEQAFGELRKAKDTLASPASRLVHWLEIHGHALDPRGTIGSGILDLFSSVSEVMGMADQLGRRRASSTTALGMAMLERETLMLREKIESMIARIEEAITAQCSPFESWQARPEDITIDEAAATARNLRFLEKWKGDLMSAYAKLA